MSTTTMGYLWKEGLFPGSELKINADLNWFQRDLAAHTGDDRRLAVGFSCIFS